MIVSIYETINGKSYVTAENYDTVLYKLKQANDKVEELEKAVKDGKTALAEMIINKEELARQNGKASFDITELHAEVNRLKGQIEAYQHMMKILFIGKTRKVQADFIHTNLRAALP